MSLFAQIVKNLKNMDKFSVAVIYHGLQLSCGLILMSYAFYYLVGRYGDTLLALACAKAAFDAAPTVATASLAAALICDIAMKDRNPDKNDK